MSQLQVRKEEDQIRRKNIRTALILVSVILVFLLGFVAKIAWFGG
jgi:hypothetical protein